MKEKYVNKVISFENVVRLDESAYGIVQQKDINKIIKAFPPDAKIADVGCGFGISSTQLSKYFENVSACDIPNYVTDDTDVQEAVMKARGIDFIWSSIGKLPYEDQSFDAVLMYAVIEHVPDKVELLKECNRVLKPGGKLFMFRAVVKGAFAERLASKMGLINHREDVVTLPQMRNVISESGLSMDKWGYQGWLPEAKLPKYLMYVVNIILTHMPLVRKLSHDFYFICTKR